MNQQTLVPYKAIISYSAGRWLSRARTASRKLPRTAHEIKTCRHSLRISGLIQSGETFIFSYRLNDYIHHE